MGEGKSGRNPADVYYDFFPYSELRETGDSSDGSPVSGHAEVNTRDDITDGGRLLTVPQEKSFRQTSGLMMKKRKCRDHACKPFHEYTVSFLAYIMWDPVHMYNAVVNDWKDVEPQITFDVRQPKTRAHSLERLRRFPGYA